ncbi:MgtC/SapB family protein [Lactobacillus helveticus]|nr:MgtC/SapB family protein [Lactobacillus helveticus]
MSFNLSFLEIILRLSMATTFAAIIGLDRKEHNHPAGLRTHILVCLGACILALIQEAICNQVLYYAKNFHTLSTVLESDPARLIAQVIGGIGFIGAGNTHHFVMGLTTAASLWATASIGLAIGWGIIVLQSSVERLFCWW